MNLSICPLRLKSRITKVDVDRKFDLRLQELGIRLGAEVVAVNKAAFGGLVLNVAGTRIAVDHKSAKRIHVEPVAECGREDAREAVADRIGVDARKAVADRLKNRAEKPMGARGVGIRDLLVRAK